MYANNKVAFLNSTFKDDNLKDHLRDSLKDMKSGVNNLEDGDGAITQDKELMR